MMGARSSPRSAEVFAPGADALQFSLLVWIPDARLDLRVASDLRFEIEEAFRNEKIEIPFPQRDLHLRTTLPAAAELDRKSALPPPPKPTS